MSSTLYWIGFSVDNDNGDVVEYKDTIHPHMVEEYAFNLWTHLQAGGFQGYVIVETYSGRFVSVPCLSPTFDFPEDWENKVG